MSDYKRGRPKKFNPFTGDGSVPPELPGEYRIKNPDGSTRYVGETNNLSRRLKEHKKKGRLSDIDEGYVEYMVASATSTSSSRREHERRSIKKHKPSHNRSSGGEGRPALDSYDFSVADSSDDAAASGAGGVATLLLGLLGGLVSFGCLGVFLKLFLVIFLVIIVLALLMVVVF